MPETLLDRLFSEELTERIAERILTPIESQPTGSREFNLNLFDVKVDMDMQTVTIWDLFEADVSMTVSVDEFKQRVGATFGTQGGRG